MAEVTLGGNPARTAGELPAVGSPAPDFTLVDSSMADTTLADFAGRSLVLNIFPSIDTRVCAASVRRFHELTAGRDGVDVLCVSVDLPFAQARFCGAEGIDGVETASAFRDPSFGHDYGVRLLDGAFAGLFARAVVVVDPEGTVVHTELVPEIGDEPDYEAALAAV